RLGATYIQLDAPHYPLLLDPRWRDFYESRGSLDLWLELDNHVLAPRPGITFGFHLCRGNQASRWLVEGGYDAIAERLFPRIAADRLLLEYDDERSGSFEPLAAVPEDKVVVLGLVSSKLPGLEPASELTARIDEAARYVGKERLALSTQCGFSPVSIGGNPHSEETQQRKLELVAEVAHKVW